MNIILVTFVPLSFLLPVLPHPTPIFKAGHSTFLRSRHACEHLEKLRNES